MEAGGRADEVAPALEGQAAARLGLLQLLETAEMAVDEHGIGQRPEVFGGLLT